MCKLARAEAFGDHQKETKELNMLLGKYLEYIYPHSDKTFLVKHCPWFKPRHILLFSESDPVVA